MLYKEDLEKMVCNQGCKEDGLWIEPKCHKEAGTWARYGDGSLRISCYICGRRIAEIAVKEKKGGKL